MSSYLLEFVFGAHADKADEASHLVGSLGLVLFLLHDLLDDLADLLDLLRGLVLSEGEFDLGVVSVLEEGLDHLFPFVGVDHLFLALRTLGVRDLGLDGLALLEGQAGLDLGLHVGLVLEGDRIDGANVDVLDGVLLDSVRVDGLKR